MAGDHPQQLTSPTGRLQFDLAGADDSEDHLVARLRSHPSIRRHLPQMPITMNSEDAAKLRKDRSSDPGFADYHIHIPDDEGKLQFAGTVGLKRLEPLHRSCEGGILLLPEFQGKGIATEAFYALLCYVFEERHLNRVYFETAVGNEQMRGWFDRVAGATLDGVLREHWGDLEDPDHFVDVASYSILAREWESVKEKLKAKLR